MVGLQPLCMSHPIGSIKLVQGLLSRTQMPFKAMARMPDVRPATCVKSTATPLFPMKYGLKEGAFSPRSEGHAGTSAAPGNGRGSRSSSRQLPGSSRSTLRLVTCHCRKHFCFCARSSPCREFSSSNTLETCLNRAPAFQTIYKMVHSVES